jgi:SAM-dependent methyltransferase
MERVEGLWAILGKADIYSMFQNALGADRVRVELVKNHVRPWPGMRILDVGCGPCDILHHLPNANYVGIDHSADYIARAKARFGERGSFICGDVRLLAADAVGTFDVALAIGLLHHLDDSAADGLMRDIAPLLAPGGRLVTLDPVREEPQHPIARLMVDMDRGKNVRTESTYLAITQQTFPATSARVYRHLINIPYSHFVMECSAPTG